MIRAYKILHPGWILAWAASLAGACASSEMPSGGIEVDAATSGTQAVDAGMGDAMYTMSDAGLEEPAYADFVVEAPGATGMGFGDPARAVNGVRGAGHLGGSFDVYSLGIEPGVNDYLS